LTYPHAVRAVILDGAVPLSMAFPRPVAQGAQRALDLLFDRCAADARCAAAFPDPRGELAALLARLEAAPAVATLRHPRTGARVEVQITRDALAEIVRVALYTPTDAARLPQIVRHALQGDFAPLAAQYVRSASTSVDDMALGATLTILCSEDLTLAGSAETMSDGDTTLLGGGYAAAWRSRCREWPVGPPIAVKANATSPVPALILSGVHDPVTPPRWGVEMGRHFPDNIHVAVPGAAHNASFTGCVPDLIATFLDRGTTDPLDAACAARVPLPPIALGDAGGRP
jgi:pimeloyl-ACP methyl ester carboxylesterase